MSDKPLNVSARAREAALEIDSLYDAASDNPCTCNIDENACRYCNAMGRVQNRVVDLIATFERDLLEEVKGRIEGLKEPRLTGLSMEAMRREGRNRVLDEALSTLTPESPSNAAEAQAGFAKEKN